MSNQCWCFHCAGKVVTRNTFVAHGRKHKPDEPVRKRQCLPLVSVAEEVEPAVPLGCFDHDDEELEDVSWRHFDPLGLGEAMQNLGLDPESRLTAAEATFYFLDWMSTYKVTDTSAAGMWTLLRALVKQPEDEEQMMSFPSLKRLLRGFEDGCVERIELCPNDCIAYYDSKHLPVPYRHEHRTKCPVCGEARHLVDPSDGKRRAAKVHTAILCTSGAHF